VAGSPLAQSKSSDVERAGQEVANQQRRIRTDQKAESAAGIGETDGEDHETAERDADGRRLWEETAGRQAEEEAARDGHDSERRSKDASGLSGNLFDLSG
jgi:hypothetical protein